MSKTYADIANLDPEQKRALLEQLLREKAAKPRSFPLSFAQQRLWFLDQLQPNSAAYNVPTVVRLKGRIDLEPFGEALDRVVARHESLRTTFEGTEDSPAQRINPPRSVNLRVVDLRGLTPAEKESRAGQLISGEVRHSFDLKEDLLIRATLIQVEVEEFILVLVTHHIISDEWSLKILFQEWSAYYASLRNGTPADLPELPIQYADFALWQRDWLGTESYQQQLHYWRERLQSPTILQLPSDKPRPAEQTFHGALHAETFPPELAERLKALCRQERCTLFMALLASFKVLLYRYTHQEDIIVGCPIAGRNQLETEPLIGFFVNTLPVRTEVRGDLGFKTLLRQVRDNTLGSYANQDMPFDKLVEELHPERSSAHMPFVQVVFSLNNEFVDEELFPGIQSEEIEVDTGTSKFDITVIAKDTPHGLYVVIEYNTDLFERETISRFLAHYRQLLESILQNPEERLSRLQLLPDAERHRYLVDWNSSHREYPRESCVHQLFEEQVSRSPDAIAAQYGNDVISYRELNARANQIAHFLQKQGVGSGALVGVFMERSVEMLAVFLAILKAGAAYVPLDLSYPKDRLKFMISDSKMPLLLTDQQHAHSLPKGDTRQILIDREKDQIAAEPRQLPASPAGADSLAYVIYTSGSTGEPKGVAVPHRAIARLVLNTDYIRITPSDRIAQASNASFDAATFEIWGALLNGARLVGVRKEVALSPLDFATALRSDRITTLFLTTALFNQMAREVPGAFRTLTTVLFGGEAVDPKWVRAVLECDPPARLLHVYGPTENTTFSSWHLVDKLSDDAQTVPIGKPIANSELYILDSELNPVPPGVTGELFVGGDGLAQGYWNRPDLTQERFVQHPFSQSPATYLYRTGDLARFDSAGNVEFVGRIDDQVKLRGFRIELGEIETTLAMHPKVLNATVLLREDIPGDKRLAAYVIAADPKPDVSELKAHLRARLPDFMVPPSYSFLEAFPMTPNGKIDRKALPAPDQNRPELARKFTAPRDRIEQQLAKVWEKVLGVQPIGVADNFFELGGHSLLAVRLFSQIEKVFEQKLPLATLFKAPSIEQMAALLRKESAADCWSTIVDIQPEGSRPPFFWIHTLGGDGGGGFFYYRKLAELLGPDQPSFGVRSPQEPFSRIEDMARFYVKEIRAFQPEGPYFLGGFCFGGNVAYEMAQQLLAAGEEVGLLVLLESSPPNINAKQSWTATAAKYSIENLVENVKDFVQARPEDQLALLKQKGRRLKVKVQNRIAPPSDESKPADLKDIIDLANYPDGYVKYAETHWQALTRYQPVPYPGELILFRAKKQSLSKFNHTLGWDALAGDRVHVTVIPGTHESMLQEPNVQIVASQLKTLLDHACSHRTEPHLAVLG